MPYMELCLQALACPEPDWSSPYVFKYWNSMFELTAYMANAPPFESATHTNFCDVIQCAEYLSSYVEEEGLCF